MSALLAKLKLCGLRRCEDARLGIELGADLLGCVLASDSPRCATVDEARAIAQEAGDDVPTVLVLRALPLAQILGLAEATGLERVQVHGASRELESELTHAGLRVHRVRAVAEGDSQLPVFDPAPTPELPALLDVGAGGAGRPFDWALLGGAQPPATYIAGGITPENLTKLLRLQPFGVDVSSGVEASPGVKDHDLLRLLFRHLSTP